MLSLLLPSVPVASQAAQSPLWGHGVSLPAWPASCPLAPREASTSSFLSSTHGIFLLLRSPLGSGSVRYPVSSALRCGSVITPYSIQMGRAQCTGRASLQLPSCGLLVGILLSSRSLLAWHSRGRPHHTHGGLPSQGVLLPESYSFLLSCLHSHRNSPTTHTPRAAPRKPSLTYRLSFLDIRRPLTPRLCSALSAQHPALGLVPCRCVNCEWIMGECGHVYVYRLSTSSDS